MREEHAPAERSLRDLTEAVADGCPVDWDGVLGVPGRDESTTRSVDFQHLRTIERAAAARREKLQHDVARALAGASTIGAETMDTQRPAFVWGRLDVFERIGGGSYADVHRAYDRELEREVALKLSRRTEGALLQRAFLAESRKLASIDHANIVFVHGSSVHDDRPGFWTDLIHGQTLAARFAHDGPLSANEAAQVAIALCGALAAMHAVGLVHCDVKPSNVMRERGGRIVLTDFGSAEYVRGDGVSLSQAISGTPLTMAPEVLVGGCEPTPACDVYGLGALLYWLVSGFYPVEAETIEELVAKHRAEERTPLVDVRHDVPSWYASIVERALEREPSRRFDSIGQMERALRAGCGEPVVEVVPNRRPPALRWVYSHRRTALWTAGVLASVIGIVIAAQVWFAAPGVEWTMYRVASSGSEDLVDGARIRAGDEVFVVLRGSRPMHVWLINEDEVSEAKVLYASNEGASPALPPRRQHRIPANANWVMAEGGGTETFLLVASRRPLADMEALLEGVPRVQRVSDPVPKMVRGEGARGGVEEVARPLQTSAEPRLVADVQRRFGSRFGVVVQFVRLTREGPD